VAQHLNRNMKTDVGVLRHPSPYQSHGTNMPSRHAICPAESRYKYCTHAYPQSARHYPVCHHTAPGSVHRLSHKVLQLRRLARPPLKRRRRRQQRRPCGCMPCAALRCVVRLRPVRAQRRAGARGRARTSLRARRAGLITGMRFAALEHRARVRGAQRGGSGALAAAARSAQRAERAEARKERRLAQAGARAGRAGQRARARRAGSEPARSSRDLGRPRGRRCVPRHSARGPDRNAHKPSATPGGRRCRLHGPSRGICRVPAAAASTAAPCLCTAPSSLSLLGVCRAPAAASAATPRRCRARTPAAAGPQAVPAAAQALTACAGGRAPAQRVGGRRGPRGRGRQPGVRRAAGQRVYPHAQRRPLVARQLRRHSVAHRPRSACADGGQGPCWSFRRSQSFFGSSAAARPALGSSSRPRVTRVPQRLKPSCWAPRSGAHFARVALGGCTGGGVRRPQKASSP